MKLVFEPFFKSDKYNTGAIWLGFLFPCHDDGELYTKGVHKFEYDYKMEDFDLDNVIVPVWDKNHDWEYYIVDIKEYLIVKIKELGPGKYVKYSLEARVIKRVPKSEITILQPDDNYELCLQSIGILKYKKIS